RSGVPVHCRVTPPRRPCIRFLFVESEFRGLGFLQIPPHGGHPCLALRFRSSRPAEDLHLLPSRHAWHTTKRPGGHDTGPWDSTRGFTMGRAQTALAKERTRTRRTAEGGHLKATAGLLG